MTRLARFGVGAVGCALAAYFSLTPNDWIVGQSAAEEREELALADDGSAVRESPEERAASALGAGRPGSEPATPEAEPEASSGDVPSGDAAPPALEAPVSTQPVAATAESAVATPAHPTAEVEE